MRGAAMRQALDIRSGMRRWQGVYSSYPPLEGEGRLTWSAAECETGWGDSLSIRALLDVEGLSPHLGSHFMRTDPPPPGRIRRSHRRLPMPHRRSYREAFGRVDDGVGVDAVVAVEVANSVGLAELLDAERFEPVSAHAAEPAERGRMAIDHGHDAAVPRQLRQRLLDMPDILDATSVSPQVPRRGPPGMEPVGRGYRQ